MSVITPVVCAVAAVAMISAACGVLLARVFWAEDLHHTREMRKIWTQTETSLRSTINSQDKIIAILTARP